MGKTLDATAHIFLNIQLLRLARIREDEMALLEHRALKNAPCALARIVYVLPPAASVGGNNANPQVAGKAKQEQETLSLLLCQVEGTWTVNMNDTCTLSVVRAMLPEPCQRNIVFA